MNIRACFQFVLKPCLLVLISASPVTATNESVQIRKTAENIELSWPYFPTGAEVETSKDLGLTKPWEPLTIVPSRGGSQSVVNLPIPDSSIFYRLNLSNLDPVRIESTSPVEGELGISVSRKTIIRLDSPLAPGKTLSSQDLRALLGDGSLVAARPELSRDGRTLTLYYLEQLPPSSRIRVVVDGSALPDPRGKVLDADGDGVPGGLFEMTFDTLGVAPLPGTAISGYVYASEKAPDGSNIALEGVLIAVDGAENTLITQTDANGFFKLDPCPGGRFFVHIDGRTATASSWPNGVYYPAVGKAWTATPGKTDNLAGGSGEIFLPRIHSDSLVAIDGSAPTVIGFPPSVLVEFPELNGVEIVVSADGIFSDSGRRGGRVGIAPVAPDRLPSPLPSGLRFPLVITVQTDGAQNFAEPAPVIFPNLPDPVTHELLPPGAITALWSFNHDSGEWEIQGPARVTADGKFVKSEPGVGIRQPGWHGTGGTGGATKVNGSGPKGGSGPPDPKCNPNSGFLFDCDGDGCPDSVEPCDQDCEPFKKQIKDLLEECSISDLMANNVKPLFCWLPWAGDCPKAGWTKEWIQCREKLEEAEADYNICKSQEGLRMASHQEIIALADQLRYIEATGLVFQLLLGHSAWGDMPFAEALTGRLLIEALSEASGENSPGGSRVTPAESQAINLLQRPSTISASQVTIAINRLNAYADGSLPANEKAEILFAIKARNDIYNELFVKRWRTEFDGYLRDIAHIWLENETILELTRESFFPWRNHFYLIEDLFSGETFRGRLQNGHFVPSLVQMDADRPFRIRYYDPVAGGIGMGIFYSVDGAVSSRTLIPAVPLSPGEGLTDSDGDGLPDAAEYILGSFPDNPDSDGDGTNDGSEIRNGRDPLDGTAPGLGIVAGVTLPNQTTGFGQRFMTGGHGLVVVGNDRGTDLFNVTGEVPVSEAYLPGSAIGGHTFAHLEWPLLVLVGNQSTELHDLTTGTPKVVWKVPFPNLAASASSGFGHVYIGGQNRLLALDAETGAMVAEHLFVSGSTISIIEIQGDSLFVLLGRPGLPAQLHRIQLKDGGRMFEAGPAVDEPTIQSATGSSALVPGSDGFVYLISNRGFRVIDARNRTELKSLEFNTSVREIPLSAIAVDGAGRLVANSNQAGIGRALAVFDIKTPENIGGLVSRIVHPGLDSEHLVVVGGFAYFNKFKGLQWFSSAGLYKTRYRSFDAGAVPPTVTLQPWTTSTTPLEQESGSWFRVTAHAGNDHLVREVEFYLDGLLVGVDDTYPFEVDVLAPIRTNGKTSFTLQAVALDTSGNMGNSAVQTVDLLNELRRPFIVEKLPADGQRFLLGTAIELSVSTNEPLATSTLVNGISLIEAGIDGVLGTGDDVAVSGSVLIGVGNRYNFLPSQPLATGSYRFSIHETLTDLSGNLLVEGLSTDFLVRSLKSPLPQETLVWSPANGAQWQGGTAPTKDDFVSITKDAVPQVQLSGMTELYDGTLSSEAWMQGGSLLIGNQVTFEGPVHITGSTIWSGGESFIKDSLELTEGTHSLTLTNHLLTNAGNVTMSGREPGNAPLFLDGGFGSGRAMIRNLAGATWEQKDGFGIQGITQAFENIGTYRKTGVSNAIIQFTGEGGFTNLGLVHIQEGTLEFRNSNNQHLGTVWIEPGATVQFGTSLFGPASHVHGGGSARFNTVERAVFPGLYEVDGDTVIGGQGVHFQGGVQSNGSWTLTGHTQFSGLSSVIHGPVQSSTQATIVVHGASGLNLGGSLALSGGSLQVNTSLRVNGAFTARANPVLSGKGTMRFDGSAELGGNIMAPVTGSQRGILQFAGPTTFEPGTLLQIQQFSAQVLAAGALDLAGVSTIWLSSEGLRNSGLIKRSSADALTLRSPLRNEGTIELSGGTLTIEDGRYVQTDGSLLLDGATLWSKGSTSAGPSFDILGGKVEGAGTLTGESLTNNGEVSPGDAIESGILDLNLGTHPVFSLYSQTAAAKLTIHLGGIQAGTQHDQLRTTGRAVLQGTLALHVSAGFDPPIGSEFVVLSANSVEGVFDTVTVQGLASNKVARTVYGDKAVTVRIENP